MNNATHARPPMIFRAIMALNRAAELEASNHGETSSWHEYIESAKELASLLAERDALRARVAELEAIATELVRHSEDLCDIYGEKAPLSAGIVKLALVARAALAGKGDK